MDCAIISPLTSPKASPATQEHIPSPTSWAVPGSLLAIDALNWNYINGVVDLEAVAIDDVSNGPLAVQEEEPQQIDEEMGLMEPIISIVVPCAEEAEDDSSPPISSSSPLLFTPRPRKRQRRGSNSPRSRKKRHIAAAGLRPRRRFATHISTLAITFLTGFFIGARVGYKLGLM